MNYRNNKLFDEPMKATGFEGKKRMMSYNNFAIQEQANKNLLENFREIIDKIDDKIQGNYQRTLTNQSLNKNESSSRDLYPEKPFSYNQ